MPVDTITDVASALAALGAVIVAWRGLNTWRQQLQGTADYELARRLLRATLQLRDEIDVLRHRPSLIFRHEAAKKTLGETSSPARTGGWSPGFEQDVYDTRWRIVAAARSTLAIELTEAEVLWGIKASAVSDPLDDCLRDLLRAIRAHLRSTAHPEMMRVEPEEDIQARELVLYDESGADENDFSKRLAFAVTHVETAVRLFLRSRYRGGGFKTRRWLSR